MHNLSYNDSFIKTPSLQDFRVKDRSERRTDCLGKLCKLGNKSLGHP